MSVKWEKQEGNVGVLTVEVDVATVNAGLDKAFKKVVKQVNVPGFRKGKMPRPLFEKKFGVESLYQDALDEILPEAYANAVEEAGISPVDRPEIDIEKMEKGENLIFTATVTVKPEVKLGNYKGLEVEKFDTTVTDEDVEAELKKQQERQAELVVKEEGAAVAGDTVVIDFEGFVDGEAFEGGKGENYSLELGSNSFIPGFEDQLIGLEAGAEKDVEVTFPEEYHAAELAGKPAVFKVKVHEIKTKQLPELDDEFAKDIDDEVETIAELKEKTKAKLEHDKKHEEEHFIQNAVIGQAVEGAQIDLPEVMVSNEVDRMMQDFAGRLQQQGLNLELYFQFSGQDEAALKGQMKEEAEGQVRTSLVLEAIAEAEKLEATEEDVEAELAKMASMYNMEVDAIKKALGNLDAIKGDLQIKKAIDFLVENSKTVEAK
ncbi:trigger factor [Peribacillus asahii]|uniref:trigger factor n=1 Tax=Peribacillus asahii TaxID=228899 RepID=UPI00207AF0B7|nr:trigger factor [Peribacillus asahii]USK69408.1 trigger factor [Peribacillus asahii]